MPSNHETALADGDPLVGQVLAGRYRIVALLGSGGMGSVYRAEHVHMKKPVAVKVLHRHMTTNAEVVARFEREAVAAGRIEHPNVVLATDFGKLEDGSFYLALEYVEGKSLADVIARGPLAPERALAIARQIADGLAAAHAAGIVHRDLKPDNVLLVERDGALDLVKVLDFGIAKLHLDDTAGQKPLTQIGTIFGTPQYMSPEQGQGRTVDGRSDLYALGVILFEMLSGTLPFNSNDLVVLITRHVTEPPPPLPESVPERVRELVSALLEKLPEARVPSATRLVEWIDELEGAPLRGSTASRRGVRAESAPGAPGGGRDSSRRGSATSALAAWKSAVVRLSRSARSAPGVLVRKLPFLGRPVTLGGATLPLGGLMLGGVLLALFGALATVALLPKQSAEHASAAASSGEKARGVTKSDEARHRELLGRAEKGDQKALAELDALPTKQRKLEDARALGRGRAQAGEWSAAMAAYKAGVLAFPPLRSDPVLLADVRRAAEEASSSEEALRLAAHQLGEKGLDLLWDVWSATRQDQAQASVMRRARQFLDDSAVREHAARELGLVLELERAEKRKRCADAKAVIAKAAEYGDERLLPILDRFRTTRGCGFVDLGDCWGCLRGTEELKSARTAVSARKQPTFVGR